MSTLTAAPAPVNLYRYGIHQNLTPPGLFFLVAIDETCKQLGVDDIEAVAAILAGQNWIPTRAKPMGGYEGDLSRFHHVVPISRLQSEP